MICRTLACRYGLIAAACCAAASGRLSADESEWKVGLAEVKITPDQPIFMAGYSSRNKPFEKVESRGIYAGGPGFFDRTAQDVLVAKIRELASQAGR